MVDDPMSLERDRQKNRYQLFAMATLEFVQLRKKGELPDPVAWLHQQNPAIHEVLRRFLAQQAPTEENVATSPPQTPLVGMAALTAFEIEHESDGKEKVLGRGGMGIVIKARHRGLDRPVALKFMQDHLRSDPAYVAQFWTEARLQAQLQHSGVPRVYEFGNDELRGPFIVMEPIDGESLAKILQQRSERNLPLERLLDVFISVCQTVAYAHKQHCAHLDLKPANILVATDGEVWITDWGNSSASRMPRTVGASTSGRAAGWLKAATPSYMAPEQAGCLESSDCKRTDVFLLGGLLCEILTGEPTYVGSSQQALEQARRGQLRTTYERLRACAMLYPELVNFARACLSFHPNERPSDAGELAAHLIRYRADTIRKHQEAEADRRWQQVRSTLVFRSALVLTIILLCGISTTSYQWWRAEKERDAKGTALVKSNLMLEQLENGQIFLTTAVQDLNPRISGRDGLPVAVRLANRLEQAAQHLTEDKIGSPRVLARLKNHLGSSLRELGSPDKAVALHTQALAALAADAEATPLETLATRHELALAHHGAGQTGRAIAILESVRGAAQELLPTDDIRILNIQANLAGMYQAGERSSDAIRLYEHVKEARIASLGRKNRLTLKTMGNLASCYESAGRAAEAIRMLEEVHHLQSDIIGLEHPDALDAQSNLALAYEHAGRLQEAICLHMRVRDVQILLLGEEHPATLLTLLGLGKAYLGVGRVEDALHLYQHVQRAQVRILGSEHHSTLNTMNHLAEALRTADRPQEALRLLQQIEPIVARKFAPADPLRLSTSNNLALAWQAVGRPQTAIALLKQVHAQRLEQLGERHPLVLLSVHNLAAAYDASNQGELAIEQFKKVIADRSDVLGPGHPETLNSVASLAGIYLRAKQLPAALALLEECRRHAMSSEHQYAHNVLCHLAGTYMASGQLKQAAELFTHVWRVYVRLYGPEDLRTLTACQQLARCYQVGKQFLRAIELHSAVHEAYVRKRGPTAVETLNAVNELSVTYLQAQRYTEAISLLQPAAMTALARLPPTEPLTRLLIGNCAMAFELVGNPNSAIVLRRELIFGLRRVIRVDDPMFGAELMALGRSYLKAQRASEAEPVLRNSLTIQEKAAPDSWLTFNTKQLLGTALLAQRKWSAAETHLLDAYRGLKARESTAPLGVRQALMDAADRLIELYVAQGLQEEEAKWRRERERYSKDGAPTTRPTR